MVRDKELKFGLQQYWNVMDEVVIMLENTLEQEQQNMSRFHKDSTIQKLEEGKGIESHATNTTHPKIHQVRSYKSLSDTKPPNKSKVTLWV